MSWSMRTCQHSISVDSVILSFDNSWHRFNFALSSLKLYSSFKGVDFLSFHQKIRLENSYAYQRDLFYCYPLILFNPPYTKYPSSPRIWTTNSLIHLLKSQTIFPLEIIIFLPLISESFIHKLQNFIIFFTKFSRRAINKCLLC